MDIYRAINPPEITGADVMELECFGMDLEKRYGVALSDIWHEDITLGEVFVKASSRTSRP